MTEKYEYWSTIPRTFVQDCSLNNDTCLENYICGRIYVISLALPTVRPSPLHLLFVEVF